MASLPSKYIFPSWLLTDVEARDEFSTLITPSNGGESSTELWAFSRWVINLSGGLLTDAQNRQIKTANRILRGKARKCWYRRYGDQEWELKGPDGMGEFLGTGDGVRTVFQARIYDEDQGKPAFLPVYALDHDIPPLGTDVYGKAVTSTRYVEVFVNGVLQTLGTHYTVQRELGTITFLVPPASGAIVKLRGGFFAVVRLNQESIPTAPAGAGWYRISDGIYLYEPKGKNPVLVSADFEGDED